MVHELEDTHDKRCIRFLLMYVGSLILTVLALIALAIILQKLPPYAPSVHTLTRSLIAAPATFNSTNSTNSTVLRCVYVNAEWEQRISSWPPVLLEEELCGLTWPTLLHAHPDDYPTRKECLPLALEVVTTRLNEIIQLGALPDAIAETSDVALIMVDQCCGDPDAIGEQDMHRLTIALHRFNTGEDAFPRCYVAVPPHIYIPNGYEDFIYTDLARREMSTGGMVFTWGVLGASVLIVLATPAMHRWLK